MKGVSKIVFNAARHSFGFSGLFTPGSFRRYTSLYRVSGFPLDQRLPKSEVRVWLMRHGGVPLESIKDISEIYESSSPNASVTGYSGCFFVRFRDSKNGSELVSQVDGLLFDPDDPFHPEYNGKIQFEQASRVELEKYGKLGDIYRLGGIPFESTCEQIEEWLLDSPAREEDDIEDIAAIVVRKFPLRTKFFLKFRNAPIASDVRRAKEGTPFITDSEYNEAENEKEKEEKEEEGRRRKGKTGKRPEGKGDRRTFFRRASLFEWEQATQGISQNQTPIYDASYSPPKKEGKKNEGPQRTLALRGLDFSETEHSLRRWLQKHGVISNYDQVSFSRFQKGWVDVHLSHDRAQRLRKIDRTRLSGRYIEVLEPRSRSRFNRHQK